jgi:uncharacterized protein (TIGR02145 family)
MKTAQTIFGMLLLAFLITTSIEAVSQAEIKIGDQVWMSVNLDVEKFRNGDNIPEAKTIEEWEKAGKEGKAAWCYYNNDPINGQKYGKLYNWYAVNDSRGLAPAGWHIPSNKEWRQLTDQLGGWKVAGKKLKSKEGWFEDGNGTNESGFSALPGGRRTSYDKETYTFDAIGKWGCFWSSTKFTRKTSKTRTMRYSMDAVHMLDWDKAEGMSVRCLKD